MGSVLLYGRTLIRMCILMRYMCLVKNIYLLNIYLIYKSSRFMSLLEVCISYNMRSE